MRIRRENFIILYLVSVQDLLVANWQWAVKIVAYWRNKKEKKKEDIGIIL